MRGKSFTTVTIVTLGLRNKVTQKDMIRQEKRNYKYEIYCDKHFLVTEYLSRHFARVHEEKKPNKSI